MTAQAPERIPQTPFRTAVWNMYNGTPIEQSEPVLRESLKWDTTLLLVNEAKGLHRARMFRAHGLEVAQFRQFLVAWDPKRFKLLKEWHAKLSDSQYFEKDGKTPVYSYGQAVLLEDLLTGLTLEAWSYHTPAHVQTDQDEPGYPMRRYVALVESMAYLAVRAKETEADGFICGGDDNWDEDGPNDQGEGFQTKDVKPILLGKATGLRQVQAGEGTFARREIDDYRILELKEGGAVKPTGVVRVRDGGGAERPAHKIHEREWVMLEDAEPLKPLRKVAKEVIAGLWGVGDERRIRLTEAGYDYEKVQAKVLRLLTPDEPPPPVPTLHHCPLCTFEHNGVVQTLS